MSNETICKMLDVFEPMFNWEGRYIHLLGGYGSGKTLHAILYMLYKMMTYENIHFLMVCSTKSKAISNLWEGSKRVCELFGIEHLFRWKASPTKIICKSTGSYGITFGTQESAKMLEAGSTKGKKGDTEITDALIDEADEIHEFMYDLIDSRCRSPHSRANNQIISCFNPPLKNNFIPKRFYDEGKILPEFDEPYYWDIRSIDRRDDSEVINKGISIRTNYINNRHLPASVVGYYENLKYINPEEYKKAVLSEWGSAAIGLRFSEAGYVENELPTRYGGVIYCDPNLSEKGKGDTTGIVKISTEGKLIYVSEAYIANTQKPEELINAINLMVDNNHEIIGFDGHHNQDTFWGNIFRLSHTKFWTNIEYKKYRVDECVKSVQFLWDNKKIVFPNGFSKTETGKRFLEQLYIFSGKKRTHRGDKDDAPDAMICGIMLLLEQPRFAGLKFKLLHKL